MLEPRFEDLSTAIAVLRWAGFELDAHAADKLVAFHQWILDEAIPGGGIGPNEHDRIWSRHIADSLAYIAAIDPSDDTVDIGSGIGLPGIPLAIARPQSQMIMLDRSERRCLLARRAVRVLGLTNVEVVCGDAKGATIDVPTAVSRATLAPDDLIAVARESLPVDATVVTAAASSSVAEVDGSPWEAIEVPWPLLGRSAFLLKASLSSSRQS